MSAFLNCVFHNLMRRQSQMRISAFFIRNFSGVTKHSRDYLPTFALLATNGAKQSYSVCNIHRWVLHERLFSSAKSLYSPFSCSKTDVLSKRMCKHYEVFLTDQSTRYMSGHSKWQNIRHIKAANDAERAKYAMVLSKRILGAVREGGSPDPKYNIQLARLVAEAKSRDVPNASIESAIAQAVKDKENATQVYFDIRGPGGIMLIVEMMTSKLVVTKNDLRTLLKKYGFVMENVGTLHHAFDCKGIHTVALEDNQVPDLNVYTDVAILVGAEEVELEKGDDNKNYLKFICDAQDIHGVKKGLTEQKLKVISSEVVFVAKNAIVPGEQELRVFDKFVEKLDENSEVVNVFTNVAESAN